MSTEGKAIVKSPYVLHRIFMDTQLFHRSTSKNSLEAYINLYNINLYNNMNNF